MLITSAAVAVTLAARRARQRWTTVGFGVISAVFVYTTVDNVVERPDGVKIGGCFILAIVVVSLASRLGRVLELRTNDGRSSTPPAGYSCATAPAARSGWSPTSPTTATARSTPTRSARSGATTTCPLDPDVIFVEVTVTDPSDFAGGSTCAARCCTGATA